MLHNHSYTLLTKSLALHLNGEVIVVLCQQILQLFVLYCFRQRVNSFISGKISESLLCNNLEKFIKKSLAGTGIREEIGWLHFAYIGIIFVSKGISHVSSIIFSFTLSKLLTH